MVSQLNVRNKSSGKSLAKVWQKSRISQSFDQVWAKFGQSSGQVWAKFGLWAHNQRRFALGFGLWAHTDRELEQLCVAGRPRSHQARPSATLRHQHKVARERMEAPHRVERGGHEEEVRPRLDGAEPSPPDPKLRVTPSREGGWWGGDHQLPVA